MRLEVGGLMTETGAWLLMPDNDDSLMGFWEISFIYFVVCCLLVFISYEACCVGETVGTLAGDCFFMFEGASTRPAPKEFGFLAIPIFLVSS